MPLVTGTDVSPELMVLAVGSGSLICSHVNDSGFWLFKEYFNLSIKGYPENMDNNGNVNRGNRIGRCNDS